MKLAVDDIKDELSEDEEDEKPIKVRSPPTKVCVSEIFLCAAVLLLFNIASY